MPLLVGSQVPPLQGTSPASNASPSSSLHATDLLQGLLRHSVSLVLLSPPPPSSPTPLLWQASFPRLLPSPPDSLPSASPGPPAEPASSVKLLPLDGGWQALDRYSRYLPIEPAARARCSAHPTASSAPLQLSPGALLVHQVWA